MRMSDKTCMMMQKDSGELYASSNAQVQGKSGITSALSHLLAKVVNEHMRRDRNLHGRWLQMTLWSVLR